MKTRTSSYDDKKSHVGLMNCFYCGKSKGVVLDRRLRNSLPHEAVYDYEPCDECAEFMRQGIILISVRDGESGDNPYRTGGWTVVTEEAIRRMISPTPLANQICRARMSFIPDEVWHALGLPR